MKPLATCNIDSRLSLLFVLWTLTFTIHIHAGKVILKCIIEERVSQLAWIVGYKRKFSSRKSLGREGTHETGWLGSMMKSSDTYCKVDGYQEADFTSSLYIVHKTVQCCGPGHSERTKGVFKHTSNNTLNSPSQRLKQIALLYTLPPTTIHSLILHSHN